MKKGSILLPFYYFCFCLSEGGKVSFFLGRGATLPGAGGGIFKLLWADCIWRRIVSGSGIPGVGVAPGFTSLPTILIRGSPGGVMLAGTLAFPDAGRPGAELTVTRSPERPGGRLLGSSGRATERFAFELELGVLGLVSAPPPQAKSSVEDAAASIKNFFI